MKTTTSQQNNVRFNDGVSVAWLAQGQIDRIVGSSYDILWGSRAITLADGGTNYAYADNLVARNPIDIGMSSLNTRGGLATVGTASIKIRDEESISDIADTYILENNEIVFYLVFVDGNQVYSDRLELGRGKVDSHHMSNHVWNIKLRDQSKTQIQPFPNELVEPTKFPNAYRFGEPIPLSFGLHEAGPHERSKTGVALIPLRMTDFIEIEGVRPYQSTLTGETYQYYPSANVYAKVNSLSNTASSSSIPSGGSGSLAKSSVKNPARTLILRPVRAKTGNDFSDFKAVATGDSSTSLSITLSLIHI